MILSGKVTFISSNSRKGNDGKTYFYVNLESADDGKIYNMSAQADVLPKMQKYQSYLAFFDIRTWENKYIFSLLDVEALPGK